VCAEDLFSLYNLMAEINYLADNKVDVTNYANITGPGSKTWLRTWLRKHHY
jgi:hypothetical protein